ncbi:repressor LexA [Balnearium lithotrophicum]|uniref:Repressor LexA n=1 Tax=Balnearium lithotrophicum TaxID=223788 RepID=A0A521CKM2_9BACT|nr:XRE family transcriptional regulator [Balnearium lithotrophicum]SMO59997.1 repressor LexA [Balnearium lithotrophicum]
MSELGKRIKKLREERGLSRLQLAKELIEKGFVNYDSVESLNQYLYMIEKGKRNPKDETLKPIADYFGVPLQWLKGEVIYIPIIGETQAGNFGGYIDSNVEEYLPLPSFIVSIPDAEIRTFFMRVEGNSMYPEFKPGDLVHLADPSFYPPENGDDVVVIKGGDATLKKYYAEEDKIRLVPVNDDYEPIELPLEESDDIMIFKVIGFYRKNR